MHNLDDVFMALVIFGSICYIFTQYLQHRQRMKMLERGITKVEFTQARRRADNSIKYGLVAIALGLALFIAQLFEIYFQARIGGEIGLALVPLFVGIALIINAFIEKKTANGAASSGEVVEMKSPVAE